MITVLRELTERIAEGSQTSFSEKSSWFRKKSTRGENFWKALETNLTKFVAGDEDPTSTTNGKKSLDVQDSRFGRIASDTNLNRMTSMPNLRAQAVTPVYSQFPYETMRAPGAHARHDIAISDRYAPGQRFEPPSLQSMQDQDYERETPAFGFGTPEPTNGGYSAYNPPAPESAPTAAPAVEKTGPPKEPEEKVNPEKTESELSETSAKEKDKKGKLV
jgi:hypothetical protein